MILNAIQNLCPYAYLRIKRIIQLKANKGSAQLSKNCRLMARFVMLSIINIKGPTGKQDEKERFDK